MGQENTAEKTLTIEMGIRGVKNSPEIQQIMMIFGYPSREIEIGEELLAKYKQLTSVQVGDYGDKYAASGLVIEKWSVAKATYMVTLKIVRVAFKDEPDMLVRFKATGRRRKSLSGWLSDAEIFYTNLLNTPVAVERLNRYSYTLQKLQQEFEMVKEIELLHSRRLTETGEAQQATVERDKAFDELCHWYSDFRAIARIALYEKPQLLEALGITVKK
jgi:hypothetical protein